jgi:hypothetical protein
MSINSRVLMTISLIGIPLAGALAQPNNPVGNQGSNNSVPAAPGTAGTDSAKAPMKVGTSGTPGGTGTAIVPGDNSSVRGDKKASMDQKLGTPNK